MMTMVVVSFILIMLGVLLNVKRHNIVGYGETCVKPYL